MSERLTVQLEDGTVEKLRELAGGPRRVGNYLSRVTDWLWSQREVMGNTPVEEFTLTPAGQLEDVAAHVATLDERMAGLVARMDQLTTRVEQLVDRIEGAT